MLGTPKGFRLHIGIYGRRNSGKSSLLNALTGQNVSIVSEEEGTTTDPVEKPMELQPIGPVLFIDTAGLDDIGSLGKLRITRSRKVLEKTDLAIILTERNGWSDFEETLWEEMHALKIPVIVVVNKIDIEPLSPDFQDFLKKKKASFIGVSSLTGKNITDLKGLLVKKASSDCLDSPPIVSDLVPAGQTAVLVVPIDLEAPKGRLILPQAQTIRELLDNNSVALIGKESELSSMLGRLKEPPSLVITDSQAFRQVAREVPEDIKMTSFSILFARLKGDLQELVKGAIQLDRLKEEDSVLICEACTHHPVENDIGKEQIPRLIREYLGFNPRFEHYQGTDFPDNVSRFSLIVHCGACMWNRRQMLYRILKAREAGVPITNYGVLIAFTLGLLERALLPFSEDFSLYKKSP